MSRPMALSTPRQSRSPSGCTASCSGFRCTIRASASSMSTARRASSRPKPAASCAAPILASSGTSGASWRSCRVRPWSAPVSRAIRWEPTPRAMPSACAALARCRLMVAARAGPPVMELISSGARKVRPRKLVPRSICCRCNSGSAQCSKAKAAKPVLPCRLVRAGSRTISRWSFLRAASSSSAIAVPWFGGVGLRRSGNLSVRIVQKWKYVQEF